MNRMREVSAVGMELISGFIKSFENKNLNDRTLREYASDLKHFIGWHEYQCMVSCENVLIFAFADITEAEIQMYQDAMKKVSSLKPSTINRRITTIKLFFAWAHQSGLSLVNPAENIKPVPIEKSEPRVIGEDEEKRMIDCVKANGSLRDQAIIKLMIHTGMRVGEVCGLKVSDVVITKSGGTVSVGQADKRRSIPLSGACRSILVRYIDSKAYGGEGLEEEEPLFNSEKTGERMTERAIRHLIKKYMDMAGLEGISAYSFRHSYGMRKAKVIGVEKLATMMGHTSLTTAKTYKKY